MGTISLSGLTSNTLNIASLSLEISLAGGIIIGIALILIVIAGFLILQYISDSSENDDEDRSIGVNKGIARIKLDNE